MTLPKLVHKEDCFIKDLECGRRRLVGLADGASIFEVSSEWTDQQIYDCLDIANRFYHYGLDDGKRALGRDIRKLLEIE